MPALPPLARCRSLLATAALAAACLAPAGAAAAAPTTGGDGVAWVMASADAEVDAAFATAKAGKKPVLLYWGAKWCPPCNQLQATLFNRRDFIERSRAVVPVYVDGDRPGAQKIAARFEVRGYPTLVLFDPQGRELNRLPGEADAKQVVALLERGLAGGRPIAAVLADARQPQSAKRLSANEWQLLSFYSWETDVDRLLPERDRPAVLATLARHAAGQPVATRMRLTLQALAAKRGDAGIAVDSALRQRVLALLAEPAAARQQADVLSLFAGEIVKALATGAQAERAQLTTAFDGALKTLQTDATLSRADRLSALGARVELATAGSEKGAKAAPPAALVAEVRTQVARDDREIRDAYERQAVITQGAWLLREAGLLDDSDALLKANLSRSHSAYYLMSQLAGNAKARGDTAGALRWHEEAWAKSEGPATRLQWGAAYLGALVDMAPAEAERIERTAQQLIDEAAAAPDGFAQRSGRSLQRGGRKLLAWNQGGQHDAVLQRLRQRLDAACAKLPAGDAQRGTCEGVLKAGAAAKAGEES